MHSILEPQSCRVGISGEVSMQAESAAALGRILPPQLPLHLNSSQTTNKWDSSVFAVESSPAASCIQNPSKIETMSNVCGFSNHNH